MHLWPCSQVIFSKASSFLLFIWSKIARSKCIFMCNNSNVVFHLQLEKTWTSPKNQIVCREPMQSREPFMEAKEQANGEHSPAWVSSLVLLHIMSPRVMGCVWMNSSSLHSSEGSMDYGLHVQWDLNITMTNLLCMVNSLCFLKLRTFLLY